MHALGLRRRDIVRPAVPGFRRAFRGVALSKPVEYFIYFTILLAGVLSVRAHTARAQQLRI